MDEQGLNRIVSGTNSIWPNRVNSPDRIRTEHIKPHCHIYDDRNLK